MRIGPVPTPLPSHPRGSAMAAPIVGLAALAVLSGGLALWFVSLWNDHLAQREETYFRQQGEVRGRLLAGALDRVMDEFVERHAATAGQGWVADFPRFFQESIERSRGRTPAFLLDEIALIDPAGGAGAPAGVAALVGMPLDAYPEPGAADDRGVQVGVNADDAQVRLAFWGPIRGPEEAPSALVARGYRFRAHLVLPSFGDVTQSGRNYAAILVVAYWLMLWVVVVAVYFLARRQQSLAFRAQERNVRLDAMSSAAEGIAHEIRNPLNGIALNAQILEKLQERGTPASADDFQRLRDEVEKIRRVTDDFVSFSRLRDIELSEFDLDEAVSEVVEDMRPRLDDVGARLEQRREGDTRLRADHPKLLRLLRSLVRNAVEALADHEGDRWVAVELSGERDRVRLRMSNSGGAVDPAVLQGMFDPFFTTRSSAIGLGLTLAKTITEAHGGTIAADVRDGGGLSVTFELPRRL